MFSLIELIKDRCKTAVSMAYPELDVSMVEVTTTSQSSGAQFGHYQLNSAMRFSKILHKPPRDLANNIVTYLQFTHYSL